MDEDLVYIEEAKSGRKEAFSFLIDKYQKQIFNFIYQFFRDYHLSLEITQETFLRAFKFINTFNNDKKFSTWLYSISKNLCIDEMKKRSRVNTIPITDSNEKNGVIEESIICMDVPHDDEMILSEEKQKLLDAIDKLPVKYKMVITMCYFDDMSYEEIAEVVDVPLSTVKIRIFRAKKKLLEYLS